MEKTRSVQTGTIATEWIEERWKKKKWWCHNFFHQHHQHKSWVVVYCLHPFAKVLPTFRHWDKTAVSRWNQKFHLSCPCTAWTIQLPPRNYKVRSVSNLVINFERRVFIRSQGEISWVVVLISARYSTGRIYLLFGVIGLTEKVFVLDNHGMFSSSVANNMPSPRRGEISPQANHNHGEEDQLFVIYIRLPFPDGTQIRLFHLTFLCTAWIIPSPRSYKVRSVSSLVINIERRVIVRSQGEIFWFVVSVSSFFAIRCYWSAWMIDSVAKKHQGQERLKSLSGDLSTVSGR